jgi:hypothetical protein
MGRRDPLPFWERDSWVVAWPRDHGEPDPVAGNAAAAYFGLGCAPSRRWEA